MEEKILYICKESVTFTDDLGVRRHEKGDTIIELTKAEASRLAIFVTPAIPIEEAKPEEVIEETEAVPEESVEEEVQEEEVQTQDAPETPEPLEPVPASDTIGDPEAQEGSPPPEKHPKGNIAPKKGGKK